MESFVLCPREIIIIFVKYVIIGRRVYIIFYADGFQTLYRHPRVTLIITAAVLHTTRTLFAFHG